MLTCGGGLEMPACRGRICREVNPLRDIPSEAVDSRRYLARRKFGRITSDRVWSRRSQSPRCLGRSFFEGCARIRG